MIGIELWLLGAARLWALLLVQPHYHAVIGRSWSVLAAALALGLAGIAALAGRLPSAEPLGLAPLLVALGSELTLGALLGLLASLPGWALLGAATTSEEALGIRGPGSLTLLLVAAALAGALALGVHRPLIHAALASFETWPVAEPEVWLGGARAGAGGLSGPSLVAHVHAASTLGLALATPVLLTRALLEIGVGSLARTGAPAAALLAVSVPGLRLAAGLIALGAAWSSYPEAFARGL